MTTYPVEELVSHGYIVAAIDQPGAAAAVVFPDGRQVSGMTLALTTRYREVHLESTARCTSNRASPDRRESLPRWCHSTLPSAYPELLPPGLAGGRVAVVV